MGFGFTSHKPPLLPAEANGDKEILESINDEDKDKEEFNAVKKAARGRQRASSSP